MAINTIDAPEDAFDRAVKSADRIIKRAVKGGIEVYASATLSEPGQTVPFMRHSWDGNEVCTAASINKLAIAMWALKTYGEQAVNTVFSWTDDDVRAGAGVFDRPGAAHESRLIGLVMDMLECSGNTATAVLGFINFHLVNAELRQRGYETTRLKAVGTGGRFETGMTTPEEALRLLGNVLDAYPCAPMLLETTRSALSRSRSYVQPASADTSWSKHGEFNGKDNDGEFVRNEVGRIEGENGYALGYAVFTRFRNGVAPVAAVQAKFAEATIATIGDVLAESVGLRSSRGSMLVRIVTI